MILIQHWKDSYLSDGSTDAVATTKPPVSCTTATHSNPHRVTLDLAFLDLQGIMVQQPQQFSIHNHFPSTIIPLRPYPFPITIAWAQISTHNGHSTTLSVSCMEFTIPFLFLLWLISGSFPESSLRWKDRGEAYPLTILMGYPDTHSRTPLRQSTTDGIRTRFASLCQRFAPPPPVIW